MSLAAAGYWSATLLPGLGPIALVFTGVLLDFCVQMNMVLGQREIYALDAASRGRLNALYVTSVFVGGAIGSLIASPLYARGGWLAIVVAGSAFPLLALLRFVAARMR